jgi:plasmid stabilization system protein ParE
MAWKVIFSARSRTDLEQIVRCIARDDPAAAERFGSKLIAQAESLADAPETGRDYHKGQARDSFQSVPT